MEKKATKRKRSRAARYHGLINQGATCYLNSVLQVLFMTKEFREAVKGSCDDKYIDQLLEGLFNELENSTANTCGITKKLGIKVNEQCDAAEYFERILRHTSPEASQIFQGKLTHKNTCINCESATNTSDPFWNLPLILETDKKDYNVEKGIKDLFQQLRIGGENQMYCEGCDAKADAEIIMEMTHHPEVLTLLLKRFKFDYRNQEYVKIKRTVTVPHTLQIPKNQTYELYAFVEHFGDLRFGHYIVTIKSHEDNEWYKFNDCSVTLLQQQQQLVNNGKSSSAYLLFYRKKKMHAAETGKTDEGEDTDHNHVDKRENSEKRRADDREDKDGETGLGKQDKKKKKQTNSKSEGVELRDDKSDAQITQKRKDDNKGSEQGIDEKSKRSGSPKQMAQSSHNYRKNDAEDQQDEILDLQPPKHNEEHGLKGEQEKKISLDKQRDVKNIMTNVTIDYEPDRSKTAGGKDLSENDKDQKKEEKKSKEDGEQAQRREETKPHHGQCLEDKDSRLLDDDSQNGSQQNKEFCVKRQIIKDEKEGENTYAEKTEQCCVPPGLSGSKELMENQSRNNGSEQMKPCDPSKREVIQSDKKPCSVEDMTREPVNEPQTINIKTQKKAGQVNGENFKTKTGKVLALHRQSPNLSPSQEPQKQSNKNYTERKGNSENKNSSTNKKKRKLKFGCFQCTENTGQSSDPESK